MFLIKGIKIKIVFDNDMRNDFHIGCNFENCPYGGFGFSPVHVAVMNM